MYNSPLSVVLNDRQKWNLSLDDENPGWIKIQNAWSGQYMRDFTEDETILKYLGKLFIH